MLIKSRGVRQQKDYTSRYPSVDPGRLKHRITLLQQTTGQDAAGANVTWAPGNPPVVISCELEPIRMTEVIRGGQDISQVYLMVTMRYRPGILPNMRLLAPSGSVYLIQAVENVLEMNAILILSCVGLGANQ